jgi:hypothetical protein
MTETSYADAIKAFAQLAIAAGAKPSHVQAALGPHAKCDTTWARKRSINQLAAAAGTAAEAIGLTFELHHPEGTIETQKFFADLGLRDQFAATMIECGAAIHGMSTARPVHRRHQQRQANRAISAEFGRLSASADALKATINDQAVQVRRFAREHQRDPRAWAPRAELLKACRQLGATLDDHDAAVRRLHRLAGEFRWRAVPGTNVAGQTRRAFMMTTRAKRNQALADTAAIRAWMIRTSPGPL